MAQLYTVGPAHIYLGAVSPSGAALSPTYLGTCEQEPQIEIVPEYEAEINALGGTKIPFDANYQGKQAFISLDLNRYNEPVYQALVAAQPGGIAGSEVYGDLGTLVLTEGRAIAVWVVFPYGAGLPGFAGKAAMIAGGMPPGYRFWACIAKGPDKLKRLSTRARVVNTLFHALRAYNPATQSSVLYDYQMAGLPAPN